MNSNIRQRLGRILLPGVIAVASFMISFYIDSKPVEQLVEHPGKASLIATMPVTPVRMIAIGDIQPFNYTYNETLYVLAANGSIYGCVLGHGDACTPGQLPGSFTPPYMPLSPVSFITSEPVIDFMAYHVLGPNGDLGPDGAVDIQLNMTASGKIWEEDTTTNTYTILFLVLILDGILSLIIAILITWLANRLLRRYLRRPSPIANQVDR